MQSGAQWPLATISVPSPYMVANGVRKHCQLEQHQKSSRVLCLGCVCVLQELADRRGCHSGESLIARESILTSRRRTAELPEEADGIEPLDDEQAVSMVPDGQHPALAGAGRGGELRSPAPKERTVVVPPDDLNGPGLVARANDGGLAGADLLGKLVRNSLQRGICQFNSLPRDRRSRTRSSYGPGHVARADDA
jgi:hypothetical protein